MCENKLNVSAFSINCIVHFINSQYWINVLFFQSFVLISTKFMKVIQVLKFIQKIHSQKIWIFTAVIFCETLDYMS